MKRFLSGGLLACAATVAAAQTNPAANAARAWRQQHERAIVDEYMSLLAIPNVSRDRENIRRNAAQIAAMMERRGIAAKLVSIENANPIVFGEIRTPGATRTIAFYAHYDGQPLDEKEWATPPFTPTLRERPSANNELGRIVPLPEPGTAFDPEWRLYARAASDDKAPIMALLAALDALRASGTKLNANIKFAFEGEEEAGSPNLERMLAANKALFAADVWLVCDGPVHQTRRPLIYFGARDAVRLDVTIYGAKNELHSGHYGNWAINPALALARLLVSMKDERGRVVVEHFYDGIAPLSATEKRAIAAAPNIDEALKREFWLGSTEGAPASLGELITQPSLNIRGMAAARVGAQGSNVIPASANASLDMRLVKGMDPRQTQDRVIAHIRRQGYFVVETPPDAEVRRTHPRVAYVERGTPGGGAVRTPMDLPISQEVIRVVGSVRGPAVTLPNMGGSLPLSEIEHAVGVHTIVIPIANHDNNQHSFNENLRIQNLWDGIELMAALLTMQVP
jgi:acetylornithine deacetylase/succinyl-diaminopimelate desuccinylase-like protein